MTCWPTQPDTVSETLRLPLRAVVASSSAMRSSRSAQQFPPRSAADALLTRHAACQQACRHQGTQTVLAHRPTPVCFDLRNDGRNGTVQPSTLLYAMFLLNPSSNPSSAAYGSPPKSPLRAPFKADKIWGRNRFDETACGIAEICDTKATSAKRQQRCHKVAEVVDKVSDVPQSSDAIESSAARRIMAAHRDFGGVRGEARL